MNSYLFLLNKLNREKLTQTENSFIIENSFKIAYSYVSHAAPKIKKMIVSEELSLEDIAIESVVPLFKTDVRGRFLKLQNALHKWEVKINSESDAMFFMNKLIARQVDQQIALILKNSDPLFAKILDSVTYFVQKEGYYKINYFGTYYIMESPDYDRNKKIISFSDFEQLPFYLFENNRMVLYRLFDYLKKDTGFFPAVPLNLLVTRLKNFYSSGDYVLKNNEAQFHLKYETVEFVRFGFEKAAEKLESYYRKRKLTLKEKNAFLKTLKLIADELENGRTPLGLFNYFQLFMKNVSRENYKSKYHHILEYLFRVMKSSIAQKLSA